MHGVLVYVLVSVIQIAKLMNIRKNFTNVNGLVDKLVIVCEEIVNLSKQLFLKRQNNFMAHFYGWGSTESRLQQSHYEDAVYFLPLRSPKWYSFVPPQKDERLS